MLHLFKVHAKCILALLTMAKHKWLCVATRSSGWSALWHIMEPCIGGLTIQYVCRRREGGSHKVCPDKSGALKGF